MSAPRGGSGSCALSDPAPGPPAAQPRLPGAATPDPRPPTPPGGPAGGGGGCGGRAPCRCGAAAAPCPGISGDFSAGEGREGGAGARPGGGRGPRAPGCAALPPPAGVLRARGAVRQPLRPAPRQAPIRPRTRMQSFGGGSRSAPLSAFSACELPGGREIGNHVGSVTIRFPEARTRRSLEAGPAGACGAPRSEQGGPVLAGRGGRCGGFPPGDALRRDDVVEPLVSLPCESPDS